MSHSLLAPSSASVWVRCPGSVTMRAQAGLPSETNDAAEEGTAAHWLAASILGQEGSDYPGDTDYYLRNWTQDPAGTLITEDMVHSVLYYLDYLKMQGLLDGTFFVEDRIDIQSLHTGCYGTADFWRPPQGNDLVLDIVDFKHGRGNVEAFENWQLLTYFAGVMDALQVEHGVLDTELTVRLHVIQPRHFGDREKVWEQKASDLRGYVNMLRAAAENALGSDPRVASGHHCKHCPARHCCPAAQKAAVEAIRFVDSATPHPLTEEALGYELPALINAIKALEYRKESLEEEAIARIRAGKNIPYVNVKHGTAQRKWKKTAAEVIRLGAISGADFKMPVDAVTPAEAVRQLKKAGMTEKDALTYLDAVIDKPKGKLKAVIDDGFKARKTFTN